MIIIRLENVPYKFSCFDVVYDKNMVVADILAVNNDNADNIPKKLEEYANRQGSYYREG